jgi:PhoPQ-activated pathogenicity-related protein
VWQHWLSIVVPDSVRYETALLYIGGGSNDDEPPAAAPARVLRFALETNSVAAELGMVPNQPLRFADSPHQARYEDDLIAYSRVKFIVTGDETWLVRLAMVKSATAAMDAMQQFLASEEGGEHAVERFVVAGGSKRGWTTWLAGAVDPRVEAIMPLVIDALNTEAITRHHFEAYGFFSPSLGDYVRHGLYPTALGTPQFRRILEIEDPYLYRERLRMPKYVINASGDQYFLPDNSRFYFPALPQEKLLRYVPNARHDLAGSDARDGMVAFYQAILDHRPRPRVLWQIETDGSIVVSPVDEPRQVLLWQATNSEARDFRLDTIGRAWRSEPLAAERPGLYRAALAAPERGFTAFFVELEYDLGGKYPLKVTTDVSVAPDLLPYRLEASSPPWLQPERNSVTAVP